MNHNKTYGIVVNAIKAFEASTRTEEDYMKFMVLSSRAFSQGVGLGGNDIRKAVKEGLNVEK